MECKSLCSSNAQSIGLNNYKSTNSANAVKTYATIYIDIYILHMPLSTFKPQPNKKRRRTKIGYEKCRL